MQVDRFREGKVRRYLRTFRCESNGTLRDGVMSHHGGNNRGSEVWRGGVGGLYQGQK